MEELQNVLSVKQAANNSIVISVPQKSCNRRKNCRVKPNNASNAQNYHSNFGRHQRIQPNNIMGMGVQHENGWIRSSCPEAMRQYTLIKFFKFKGTL